MYESYRNNCVARKKVKKVNNRNQNRLELLNYSHLLIPHKETEIIYIVCDLFYIYRFVE